MIDPDNITDFCRDVSSLEEVLLFWILVAGKEAKTTAKRLDVILKDAHQKYSVDGWRPFAAIRKIPPHTLSRWLKSRGVGCSKAKSKSLREVTSRGLDLRTCSLEDLESVYGIGPKTARCFLMHSRRDINQAGLDTHILKFLRSKGYDAPVATPTGKRYKDLEQAFLRIARDMGKTPAELDLEIWRRYSSSDRRSQS